MKKTYKNVIRIMNEDVNSYNDFIQETNSFVFKGETYVERVVDGKFIYDNERDSFDYSN